MKQLTDNWFLAYFRLKNHITEANGESQYAHSIQLKIQNRA